MGTDEEEDKKRQKKEEKAKKAHDKKRKQEARDRARGKVAMAQLPTGIALRILMHTPGPKAMSIFPVDC